MGVRLHLVQQGFPEGSDGCVYHCSGLNSWEAVSSTSIGKLSQSLHCDVRGDQPSKNNK